MCLASETWGWYYSEIRSSLSKRSSFSGANVKFCGSGEASAVASVLSVLPVKSDHGCALCVTPRHSQLRLFQMSV